MTVKGQDIAVFLAGAEQNRREARRDMSKRLRRIAAPTKAATQAAFRSLGGTGPRVARTVKMTALPERVTFSFGSAADPYSPGREFGAKRDPYSRPTVFGGFTGNQFELGVIGNRLDVTTPAGNAFFPTMGKAAPSLYNDLQDGMLDEQAGRLS